MASAKGKERTTRIPMWLNHEKKKQRWRGIKETDCDFKILAFIQIILGSCGKVVSRSVT